MNVRIDRDGDKGGVIAKLANALRQHLESQGGSFRNVVTVLLTYYPDGMVTYDAHGFGA